jgi:hypothetical protein
LGLPDQHLEPHVLAPRSRLRRVLH